MQRIYQGRSTSLNNLGLCHSAARPVFPVNVSNMYDLEEEELDFEIYGSDDVEDTVWDNTLLQEEEDFMEEVFERQRQEDDYIYNHGEIPSRILNNTRSSDSETELPRSDYSTSDSIDGVIGHEITFQNSVNQRLREMRQESNNNEVQSEGQAEIRQGSDEIIQQSSGSITNDGSQQESIELEDYFQDIAENTEDGYELWTGNDRISPSQMGWSPVVIVNGQRVTLHADDSPTSDNNENRDGWGDEIVSELQQSSIEENISMDENDAGVNSSERPSTVEEIETTTLRHLPSYCIPNIMKTTISSQIEQVDKKEEVPKPDHTLGEYLMISTGKDVTLMSTSTPKMGRIRAEHNMINKVDVRSDQMLSVLDRINMVEWLPELELYVAASQKGTVALMRVLQIEFEGGEQACIFNNEYYLPTNVLQSTPLYGMSFHLFLCNFFPSFICFIYRHDSKES